MNRRRPRCSSLALLCALSTQVQAQTEAPPAQARFQVEAGAHDLVELVDRAARYLDRNIILDPNEMVAKTRRGAPVEVRLQHALELDAEGCEEFISQVAYSHGLVLSPVDPRKQTYELIGVRGNRRQEIRAQLMTPNQVRNRRYLYMKVQTVVQVKHVEARSLANSLRPMLMGGRAVPLVMSGVNDGVLLIQGLAADVARATELVEMADLPPTKNLNSALQQRIRQLEAQRSELLLENRSLRKKLEPKNK